MTALLETLRATSPTLIALSLAAFVVVVGLDSSIDNLLYVIQRPLRLAKAVLAVNVIVPIAAVLIVFLLPLSSIAKAGILLMAVSPVPAAMPRKGLKLGGEKSYVYGLFVALAALSIILVPLAVEGLSRLYGVDLSLSPVLAAQRIGANVLLPLAAGLAVRRAAPVFAERIRPVMASVANILLVVAVAPLIFHAWPSVTAQTGNGTALAMALTSALALAAGHLLGGPELQARAALAVTAASRHPGIAMMIVGANGIDKHVTAAIVLFAIVGTLVAFPYQIWMKRRILSASKA